MSAQWTTTSKAAVSHGVKALVYSPSGAGKTLLCATAPRPCILSAESGLLSLSRRNIERVFGVDTPGITYDIPVMQVTNLLQLRDAFNWFANPANNARQHFDTICLDSITEIAEVMLKTYKSGKADARQAYGDLLENMLEAVKQFRDLPGWNVYFSSKMEPMKDEATGMVKYGPMMPGSKLSPQLPYLFDEVFCLGIGTTQQGAKYRYLRTDQDLQYIAKDRSGLLDEIEKPDLSHVIRKITGAHA
jgi:hypothetical protein